MLHSRLKIYGTLEENKNISMKSGVINKESGT